MATKLVRDDGAGARGRERVDAGQPLQFGDGNGSARGLWTALKVLVGSSTRPFNLQLAAPAPGDRELDSLLSDAGS